ncbi:uncharacterized protein LOC110773246 [Prunus avium]|uniref:Uncharacterized protein LOC110773246 n=1 Tax=Prunus avium TaxID=42229 RepID=A0A6P5U2U8_PRUAV|nr:uncharacterized protein LOC110773246 [Prunus avium]
METQHTDTRGKRVVIGSNDSSSVQISKLEQKLDALLALNSRNPSKEVCSICETQDHATIACPLGAAYPEFVQEQAKVVNSYNQGPRNDPYSQSYNPGWRNHPNFSWRNTQNQANPPSFQRPQSSSSLEDIVKQMAINQSNFQQTTQAAISKLEVQLGQIAAEITQREPGKWPSQTVDNKVDSNLSNDVVVVENEDEEEEITTTKEQQPKTSQYAPKAKSDSQEPNPFQLHKRDEKFIPAYGKFIKNVSAVLQRKLPPKLEDPGSFDIPINIGDKKVGRAMLDLGASINLMPYSVYQKLGLEGMKKT